LVLFDTGGRDHETYFRRSARQPIPLPRELQHATCMTWGNGCGTLYIGTAGGGFFRFRLTGTLTILADCLPYDECPAVTRIASVCDVIDGEWREFYLVQTDTKITKFGNFTP
jgi:hypothetical protein